MKVIFLDFDGVMIIASCFYSPLKQPGSRAEAHPDCVVELNRITDATGAAIVVSSVHRKFGMMADVRARMIGWGVTGKIIDRTPEIRLKKIFQGKPVEVSVPRGREISKWIQDYRREEITSFVILDDDTDMEEHLPRLVRTDFENGGLTKQYADRAIAMLQEAA